MSNLRFLARLGALRTLCLIAGVLFAGCGGNNPPPCTPVLGVSPYMPLLYPAAGATSVPTAAGVLIIGVAPGSQTVVLANADGDTIASGAAMPPPSPLPGPLAIPSWQPLASLSYPALSAATTYTVSTRSTYDNGCPYIGYSGTFTTR
jgi:hypothetical protein